MNTTPTPIPSSVRLALAACAASAALAPLSAATLLSENFNTGVPLSGWYWTGGSFESTPSFGQAYNQVSSSYQIFTKAFASTDLAAGDKLQVSFDYNPNSTNITRVWVSLFGGSAATVSGWNQYSSSAGVSDTWTGYSGGIATSNAPHQFLRAAGGAGGDYHPYATWDATPGFAATNTVNSTLGTGAVRSARLVLENTGTSIVMSLFEGSNPASLGLIYSATDSSAGRKTTGYNILAFEFDSSGNGDMRYDNILVEHVAAAIPEPSAFAACAGVAATGCVGLRRRRRA